MSTRRHAPAVPGGLAWAAASTVGGGVALAVWGALVEPRLIDRQERVAVLPDLPPAWRGQRVALLADAQVGAPLGNTDTVRRIVALVVRERPALVLVAGDFVYGMARDPVRIAGAAADLFRPLPEAGIPTYAVLGNHDHAVGEHPRRRDRLRMAGHTRGALEAVGVRVLVNEVVALGAPTPRAAAGGGIRAPAAGREADPPLYLVGLGDHMAGTDEPAAAFRDLPPGAPRIVLMHDPDTFRGLPDGAAPLALAGHTHGGQIRVPLRPTWSLARLRKPWPQYRDGWILGLGAPHNRLYVNRGMGFSLLPLRIGCPPEVTFITLEGGSALPPSADARTDRERALKGAPTGGVGAGVLPLFRGSTPPGEGMRSPGFSVRPMARRGRID